MVERSKRTRSVKKVKVRTPGGVTTTHFRGEKSGKPKCGLCGTTLSAVKSGTTHELRSVPKSGRVPARPYAGVLCTNCLDSLIRYVTRMETKYSSPQYAGLEIQRNLELEKFLPRGWFDEASKGKIKKLKASTKPLRGKGEKKASVEHKHAKKTTAKKAKKA